LQKVAKERLAAFKKLELKEAAGQGLFCAGVYVLYRPGTWGFVSEQV